MRLSEFVPVFLSLRSLTVFAHAYVPHDLHDLVSLIVSPHMTYVTLFSSFTCPSVYTLSFNPVIPPTTIVRHSPDNRQVPT